MGKGVVVLIASTVMISVVIYGFTQLIMHSTQNSEKVEAEIFELINETRSSYGLPTLSKDGKLVSIASSWSEHLAETGELTHGNFEARLMQIGYFNFQCGEVIGMYNGWTSNLADEFIDMWLDSEPHREIILTPLYGYMGIGVSEGIDGFFAVVDFRFI